MASWIQPSRVRSAIVALATWRQEAKSQAAMHLWPLLAIVEKGANSEKFITFEEADDFQFWDRYARFPGESRGQGDSTIGFTEDYYIDPLMRLGKPSDYPHRSPSTIRKRTFLNSWKAALLEDDDRWKLAKNFADIFKARALQRDDVVHRVPVVDLAVWLFRHEEFPDDATAKTLELEFQNQFKFSRADYDKLFVFSDENPEQIFTDTKPDDGAYRSAIRSALLGTKADLPAPPPLYTGEASEKSAIGDDDPVLQQVRELLAIGTSGIIFRGCPGTSKTWYAKQIARQLAASPNHIHQVQFHPSYGYEDFVEGYRPDEDSKSGFKVTDKVFLAACDQARDIETPVVFIIDEINRGDPARVFGELLTYIEFGYRGDSFQRAYTGKPTSVPKNLLILGTMNQADKSITQLDLALLRRFDHIDMQPSAEILESFLQRDDAVFTEEQIELVSSWFESLQKLVAIGHTYFNDVRRPEHIQTVWRYRMLPYCEAVLELDLTTLEHAKKSFESMYRRLIGQADVEAT